jgi:type IV secretion system protein VirB10
MSNIPVENELPDENIPSLNQESGNKSTKKLVAALVLVLIALGTIIYVKTPRELKKSAKHEDNNSTSNMAPFPTYTPPPPPPNPEVKPFEKVMGVDKKKELTRDDLIKMPGLDFGSGGSSGSGSEQQPEPVKYDAQGFPIPPKADEESELAASLKPTKLDMVSATILPDRDFLLTRGTIIDCDIQEAIDNRMPGFLMCLVARDVYSESGHVLLIPRGTEIDGEGRGNASATPGQVRIAALFNRIKTPNGIIADMDSPAADSLGRTGVEGEIDYHFWERFGAAMAISLFDTTWQIAASRLIPSNGGVTNNFGGGYGGSGKSVVDNILSQEARIRPSILSDQSSRIQITLARDISFKTVIRLVPKP